MVVGRAGRIIYLHIYRYIHTHTHTHTHTRTDLDMAALKDSGHLRRGGKTLFLQGRERGADLGAREGFDLCVCVCVCVCECK